MEGEEHNKVYILENPEEIKSLNFTIANMLLAKAKRELVAHDMRHRTMLGNTNFWFHLQENGQLMLVYDRHPKEWDIDSIKETLWYYERAELKKMGCPLD